MAFLGMKSCHEQCQTRIQEYLEKDGRAIERDFLNLPGREERRLWAYTMDKSRSLYNCDRNLTGGQTVTYRHYVISPDIRDDVDLETLRDLSTTWAREFFGDEITEGKLGRYEVAIIYHDDNTHHIPHAHLIVNCVNFGEGPRERLHVSNKQLTELQDRLQELARERGLRYIDRNAIQETKAPRRYYTKVERALKRDDKFVWKDDLANMIDVARCISPNIESFYRELDDLGVGHYESEDDKGIVFQHPSNPERWKCSGYRIGKAYRKEELEAHFETLSQERRVATEDRFRNNVNAHLMQDFFDQMELGAIVDRSVSVKEVAFALRYNDIHHFRSTSEMRRRLDHLRKQQSEYEADGFLDMSASMKTQADELERALATFESGQFFDGVDIDTLPKRPARESTGPATSGGVKRTQAKRSSGASSSRTRATTTKQTRQEAPRTQPPKRTNKGRSSGGTKR